MNNKKFLSGILIGAVFMAYSMVLMGQWSGRHSMPGVYPFYEHIGTGITYKHIVPNGSVYGVGFLRTGTDTITVYYHSGSDSSMSKIPPAPGGGVVTISDQMLGPIISGGGISFFKDTASEIIITGGTTHKWK